MERLKKYGLEILFLKKYFEVETLFFSNIEKNPVRCPDIKVAKEMVEYIKRFMSLVLYKARPNFITPNQYFKLWNRNYIFIINFGPTTYRYNEVI